MEKKFKCKDEVIYRYKGDNEWTFGLFSHYGKNDHGLEYIVVNGMFYRSDEINILPYEGNEHLVGSQDEPEPEIRLEEGELIVAFDVIEQFLEKRVAIRKFIITGIEVFFTNQYNWHYAIRFSDFNPSNIEETKKHILCVKNGKIVRYKG